MIRMRLVQPVMVLALAVVTGCMKEKNIELEQVKIEPLPGAQARLAVTTRTAQIEMAFLTSPASPPKVGEGVTPAAQAGPQAAAPSRNATTTQTAAPRPTPVATPLIVAAAATPEVEAPDYEMNTDAPVDFSGQFLVKAMHFETRNQVLTLKMTVQCTRETSPTAHFVFVHVIKNDKAAFGLDNQPLMTKDRNLKRGDEVVLSFVTQTEDPFNPKAYDGLRFGVVKRVGGSDVRLTVAKTLLKTKDHQTAVFWKFN